MAVAALMVAACTQKENPVEDRTPVALQYTTVDATETKAAQNLNEGTFASGETVKVRISNTGEGNWDDYDFTTGSAGAMSPASIVPYYPTGARNIDIVACYPSTAGASFSVQADQTADADYKASDLMFASVTNQAKQAEAVNLAFTHKLAKINVNVTAGTGVGSITSVSLLNIKPTVSFNQATGAVGEASGSAGAIAISNNGAAIIPAQTIDGGLLSIVTDKGTATYTVSSKEFAAGQQYTINITVNLRNIGTTNAITGWTSEGTVTIDSVRPSIAGHEYVVMGGGLKWAVSNVGATLPWDYGDYFQWGVTVPLYADYNWDNYLFMAAGYTDNSHITKYNSTDLKETFADYDYADDAARQRWGSSWRTPTKDEWNALFDNNTRSWQTDYLGTGISGFLVTSDEGNSIFLPAAGQRQDGNLNSAGSAGYYWTSLCCPASMYMSDQAYYLYFKDGSYPTVNNFYRCLGMSIRPVSN